MRRRLLPAEPQRLHAVEAHAHADVPADHVGDGQRALHHRAELVALLDVLPPPRLAPRGAPAAYCASIAASASSVYGSTTARSSYFLSVAGLAALGADHEPVLRRRAARPSSSGTPAPSTRAPPDPRTRSALSSTPTRALRRHTRRSGAAAPTTPGRSPRRTRARRAAGRPCSSSRCSGGDLGHLVLADQRVAADERRRGDRPAPPGRRAVRRVAPQRVVVAVGLARRGGTRPCPAQVVRRLRVGLGEPDAGPQPGDALVGDRAGLSHDRSVACSRADWPRRRETRGDDRGSRARRPVRCRPSARQLVP